MDWLTLFRYQWYFQKFSTHRAINGLFYYLRKIPAIGASIPETVYRSYGIKQTIFYLILFLDIPRRILAKCLWLAIHVGVGSFLLNLQFSEFSFPIEGMWTVGMASWLLFIGGIYRLAGSFDPFISKSKREFMEHFGLHRKTFLLSQIFCEPLLASLTYLPALLIYCSLAGNWVYLPIGLLTPPAATYLGQMLNRILFARGLRYKRTGWKSTVFGLAGLIPYALAFYFTDLTFLVLATTSLVSIAFSYRYLVKTDFDQNYVEYCMEQSLETDRKIDSIKLGNEYTRQGLAMQEKLSIQDGRDLSHLKGMAYLNALLFERYRSILANKLYIRLAWLIIPVFIIEAIRYLDSSLPILTDQTLLYCLPFSLMILYAASLGKSITQLVFVNCDIAMLHYPFYRKPQTILSGFFYRFRQILGWNAPFAVLLYLAICVEGRFAFHWTSYLLMLFLFASIILLLSFHDLFIYYILQPFTQDMKVTNPLYRILSGATYWLAYLNTQLRIDGPHYLIGLSLAICLYVGIGFLILSKKAPQTFRLKQ